MDITFQPFCEKDLVAMKDIWNDILIDGIAFPGTELYGEEDFADFLRQQSAVTCMLAGDNLMGYYILHPNNIGRCSHVANASYCMSKQARGKHLGKMLVERSIQQAKELGFRGMQFNAVVVSNKPAIHIYQSVGFQVIGTIPGGFLLKDGTYSDMLVMYLPLV